MGKSPTGDVGDHGGVADTEPCGDVADEVTLAMRGEQSVDLIGLEAPLGMAVRARAARV